MLPQNNSGTALRSPSPMVQSLRAFQPHFLLLPHQPHRSQQPLPQSSTPHQQPHPLLLIVQSGRTGFFPPRCVADPAKQMLVAIAVRLVPRLMIAMALLVSGAGPSMTTFAAANQNQRNAMPKWIVKLVVDSVNSLPVKLVANHVKFGRTAMARWERIAMPFIPMLAIAMSPGSFVEVPPRSRDDGSRHQQYQHRTNREQNKKNRKRRCVVKWTGQAESIKAEQKRINTTYT